jgi:hypothetical protein
MNDNSYFAHVLRQIIFSCTIGSTWKLSLDNGDNKYTMSLHFILYIVVYVKPSFVALDKSNTRWSEVKPCAQCIMHVAVN